MSVLSWLATRRRAVASTGTVTAAVVVLGTLAWLHPGFPVADVDLNDGDVWITKTTGRDIGRFNSQSQVLDAWLGAKSTSFDVLQSGRTVLLLDTAAATLSPIDPVSVSSTGEAALPAGASVTLGGGTVAIVDPAAGALRMTRSDAVAAFSKDGEPLAKLGAGARAVAGPDGSIYAVAPATGEQLTFPVDANGVVGDPERTRLDGLEPDDSVEITVVGTTAVVHDVTAGALFIGASRQKLDDETARMQQPSGPAGSVAIATATELVSFPLDGGAPTRLPAGGAGRPAEPVNLNGCVYAAWAASGRFLRDCEVDANDLAAREIPGIASSAQLRFRVNRDVVVLNDVVGGTAWISNDALEPVDNWDDVVPPEGDDDSESDSTETVPETALPERTETNRAPDAFDDVFGVRPGRTTILPVLDNDSDPDGDVLLAAVVPPGPGIGAVSQIYGGRALQITVPPEASGADAFTYRVSDGRGGEDTAVVTLDVVPDDVNRPPVQYPTQPVIVEKGGQAAYNVLPDWSDPDGDDLFLVSATVDGGDVVSSTPDGVVTFLSRGTQQGLRDVTIQVSDGRGEPATGVLTFDVRPTGTTGPLTDADHVVTRVGERVSVYPLSNDRSPSGSALRLAHTDQPAGAQVDRDEQSNSFTFVSATPGTYYVQYLVDDENAQSAKGLVRIDVLAAADPDAAPIAVRDVALLQVGRDVKIDVLANDSDPAGGILVVQSVTVPDGSPVSVAVVDHRYLHITDAAGVDAPVTLRYRVSNGAQSAEADVVVIPVPAPVQNRPPRTQPETVNVRSGDVVTIPVLANDSDPDGDVLTLSRLVDPAPAVGEAFIAENAVRFRAPEVDETTSVTATYEVVDPLGAANSAVVTIRILPLPDDEQGNSAPRPRDLTVRALAGQAVQIGIPLDGIDPDGDSVELLGPTSSPTKGRIDAAAGDAGTIVYQALADETGVDSFTYEVRDRLGRTATATIQIGIAQPETANQRPVALRDVVSVRPDRRIVVPVLENDSDPDNARADLRLAGVGASPDGIKAEVAGRNVRLTTTAPGTYAVQYRVEDPLGASATGAISITVDPEVPLLAPVARDDRVKAADVVDGSTVDVPVLDNDGDPDGDVQDLSISVRDGDPGTVDGDVVRVTVGADPQIVTYTVEDPDGNTASAFIFVPGTGALIPSLRLQGLPLKVETGTPLEIDISDHVDVAGGGRVILTEAGKVQALHADGAPLAKDETHLVYTSAEGYIGEAAITFEVTDGAEVNDPAGRKATLTIPIVVEPHDNVAPEFVGSTMQVAPGEDASTLDLRALSKDANEGDLKALQYSVQGVPSGWAVPAPKDGTLSVAVPAEAKPGQSANLEITVTDPKGATATGTIAVTVTKSTRPLPMAVDDIVGEAPQGVARTIDVLANDIDPFQDGDDKKLTIVGSPVVETGTDAGTVKVDGGRITVTPAADFVGTLVVRYRIADRSPDADRQVDGRIRMTVIGRPDAPTRPLVQEIGDRRVILSWTPPNDNGAPILHYTVTSANGVERECATTTCTIDQLTNNVEYTFTVTATNKVGESPASAASDSARPDARPDKPQPATAAWGDKQVSLTWATPSTPGSPVTSYDLQIRPAPPSGSADRTGVTGTSLVWTGLENGTSYQVRVRAINRAPEPSEWSDWSASAIPAGPPAAPAQPGVARLAPVGAQAQVEVSWTPPNANGDAVSGYTVYVVRGGAVQRSIAVAAGQTRLAVNVDTNTTDYTFRVSATNKAGEGTQSPDSASFRAFTAAAAPTNVQATTPASNSSITVAFDAPSLNGADAGNVSYQYALNGGGWAALAANRVIGGLANGTSYTVAVRAVTSRDGATYEGAASAASNSVIPYGALGQPATSSSANGVNVTFNWSPPTTNGRAQTFQVLIDGAQVSTNASGSYTVGGGYDQDHTVRVIVKDAAGQQNEKSETRRSGPRPTWNVTVDGSSSCLEDSDTTPLHYGAGPSCSSSWAPANSTQVATCVATWTHKSSGGNYRWFRLTSGWYLSVWTTVNEYVPPDMPSC